MSALIPQSELAAAVEALMMLAEEPTTPAQLAEVLEIPTDEVEEILGSLAEFYDTSGRGFELRKVAGGWRYYTRPQYAGVIARSVLAGQHSKLSQAALETLSVVAYLQPVSRQRISSIRGVNVDGVMRTLQSRGMICEVGTDEETGAMLFGTTAAFLEHLGLQELSELPPMAPYLPDANSLAQELAGLSGESVDG